MSNSTFEIGCFGKLPICDEFIRYNADMQELSFLDQWLQEGMNQFKSHNDKMWDTYYSEIPPYYFLLHLKGSRRYFLGLFVSSQDKGGRRYPFIVFVSINFRKFNYNLIFVPLIFGSFLRAAESLVLNGWKNSDKDQFLRQVKDLNLQLPSDPKNYQDALINYFNTKTNKDLWVSLFGTFEDPRKHLVFQNLVQALMPLRQRNIQKFSLGLMFPIASHDGIEAYNISFWLYFVGRLLGRALTSPVLFWNKETVHFGPRMLLFLQPPVPDSFSYLIKADSEDERLCVLDRDGEVRPENLNQYLWSLIDKPDLSLYDLGNLIRIK